MKSNTMQVQALENGTVIDHIPADKLFKIVSLLKLNSINEQITIGNNLESKKLGRKGIIKISNKFFEKSELDKIALIAPSVKINVIKNFEVIEKQSLSLPDEVTDILQCVNPMCVTNKERGVATRFHIIDKENGTVQCHYCERQISRKDLILK